jgi:Zn-dependent protease
VSSSHGIEIAQESSSTWVVRTKGGRYVRVNALALGLIESLATNADLPPEPTSAESRIIAMVFKDESMIGSGHLHIKARIDLLTPSQVNKVADWLQVIFRFKPGLMVCMMPVAGLCLLLASFLGNPSPVIGMGYALVASLILIGSLIHELGHAAALVSFGRKSKGIGFGFFIFVMPCFFADVSESWLLSRRQKIIISAAGCASQTIFGIVLYLIGVLAEQGPVSAAFAEAARLTLAFALFQLLPFHKSDGHWILRDLLTETSDPGVRALIRITTAIGILLLAVILYKTILGWQAMAGHLFYLVRTGYAPDEVYSMQTVYTLIATLMIIYLGGRFAWGHFMKVWVRRPFTGK